MLVRMTTSPPWVRGRGFDRLLAQETNISDLLQFLSDRDSRPWAGLVGFVPKSVDREARRSNNADLLLTADDEGLVAVEVKLGHVMSAEQQANYERLPEKTKLYLAALSMDEQRLAAGSTSRWSFLSLVGIFDAWTDIDDEVSRVLASQAVTVLRKWDAQISAVFEPPQQHGSLALNALTQKFLARVVTRRIAVDLRNRGRLTYAGVANGGGMPLVQAWTPIRDEGTDRCFMAEVRWRETDPRGELRFGVDFKPRPGETEDEEVRRAAFELSRSMDSHIDFMALKCHLEVVNPRLAGLLGRKSKARPVAKGDWERVVRHGFTGTVLPSGKKNSRRVTHPGFYGDGALRFQAIVGIDFATAYGQDIADLLDATLTYLVEGQPA
jgi:hypothetical protein